MRRLTAFVSAVTLSVLTGVPAALAADKPGILVVDPPIGQLTTQLSLMTAGYCERGVGFVVAVQGDGIDPEQAGNLVGMTDLDTLIPNDLGVHAVAARSIGDYFVASAGTLPQAGEYTLIFACRNRLDTEWLQTFEATALIAADGSYEIQGDSAKSLGSVLDELGYVPPETATQVEVSGSTPEAGSSPTPANPAPETSAVAGAEGSEQPPATQDVRWLLIAGGALLILGAGWYWLRQGRSES